MRCMDCKMRAVTVERLWEDYWKEMHLNCALRKNSWQNRASTGRRAIQVRTEITTCARLGLTFTEWRAQVAASPLAWNAEDRIQARFS
jgi:hypothetical protein